MHTLIHTAYIHIFSHTHTSLTYPDCFFLFFFVVAEKGSDDISIEFPYNKTGRFCRALITGDEPKKGAKSLWGYVSCYTSGMYNSP